MIAPQLYRREMASWLAQREWHYHVVLAFNDPKRKTSRPTMTGAAMRASLRQFDRLLCRHLLGKRWHRFAERRPEGIFFVEKRLLNPHWDGLMVLPEPEWQCENFEAAVKRVWRQVAPAGSAKAPPYDPTTRLSTGVPVHAYYPTKEILTDDHIEHFTMLAY